MVALREKETAESDVHLHYLPGLDFLEHATRRALFERVPGYNPQSATTREVHGVDKGGPCQGCPAGAEERIGMYVVSIKTRHRQTDFSGAQKEERKALAAELERRCRGLALDFGAAELDRRCRGLALDFGHVGGPSSSSELQLDVLRTARSSTPVDA